MSSIKIRTKLHDGKTEIRTLISHPMETGRNRAPETGEFIAAHFIQALIVKHNGEIVIASDLGVGISKNPFFSFQLDGGAVGDKIEIQWTDNLGNQDIAETLIK